MLLRVALVRTEVSEECIAFKTRGTKIGEIATTLAVTSNRSTLRISTITCYHTVFLRSLRRMLVTANVVPSSSILSTWLWRGYVSPKRRFLTRTTRCNNPEDGILHCPLSLPKHTFCNAICVPRWTHCLLFLRCSLLANDEFLLLHGASAETLWRPRRVNL
jgi:hypothetical protein